MWLINTHNGIKENQVNPINVEHYPAVKKHLDSHYLKLKNRTDKGDTLYNLRNCAYMEDFFRPKLLWAETMRIHKQTDDKFPRFGYDETGDYLTDKTCFFATGKSIKYILAVLNSSIGKYLCSQYVSILDDGGFLMQKVYLEKIPFPKLDTKVEKKIESIVNDFSKIEILESEIDKIIFRLYDLSEEEVEFVNSQ